MIYQPVVAGLIFDSSFANLLEQATLNQGGRWIQVVSPKELHTVIERYFPVLIWIDLDTICDWQAIVNHCKWLPHLRQIPIHGAGTEIEVGQQGKLDRLWHKAQHAEIASIIVEQIDPPIYYPLGWDDPLPDVARQGLVEFNNGEFFEQHELLEAAWQAEERPIRTLYQGILQVGVAFLQIQRGNWPGAIKVFRRGLPKLRGLPPICQGIHVGELRTVAEELHTEISALEPTHLVSFDQTRFPKIRYE